jgi:hypothetical protein
VYSLIQFLSGAVVRDDSVSEVERLGSSKDNPAEKVSQPVLT